MHNYQPSERKSISGSFVQDNFIRAKLDNLLRETRHKICDIEKNKDFN